MEIKVNFYCPLKKDQVFEGRAAEIFMSPATLVKLNLNFGHARCAPAKGQR
jgi:hypothetical protein